MGVDSRVYIYEVVGTENLYGLKVAEIELGRMYNDDFNNAFKYDINFDIEELTYQGYNSETKTEEYKYDKLTEDGYGKKLHYATIKDLRLACEKFQTKYEEENGRKYFLAEALLGMIKPFEQFDRKFVAVHYKH